MGRSRSLVRCLREDESPLVRSHAAWALGEIGGSEAALREALGGESDRDCLEEIRLALEGGTTGAPVG